MLNRFETKKPVRISLLGLLGLTGLIGACFAPQLANAEQSAIVPAIAPAIVTVTRPERVTTPKRAVLPATVEPSESAMLFARVTGYVESVSVEIGDDVEAGSELARIVVPEMGPRLAAASARVTQEKAELALAQRTLARMLDLRKQNPDAVARQALDQSSAAEEVERAQLQLAEADLTTLGALAGFAVIRAPFAGRISKRFLHPGALAKEGTAPGAEAVVEIIRIDRLRLRFDIPEPMVSALTTGHPASVHFDALPSQDLETTIARVSGQLDPATRSMRAEIDLGNENAAVKPGMYARIELNIERLPTWSIPSRAVRGKEHARYVLVVERGLCVQTEVTVAEDDGRQALIRDGLADNDSVVVAGSVLAHAGGPCEIAGSAQ
jgi:RND family efflux transporter MFP subunit